MGSSAKGVFRTKFPLASWEEAPGCDHSGPWWPISRIRGPTLLGPEAAAVWDPVGGCLPNRGGLRAGGTLGRH